jgi:hypothetical protein
MIDREAIRLRWEADGSRRDERGQRLFAASEARTAGWGGVVAVAEITGLARSRIIRGLKDLGAPPLDPGRVRRQGGGRHVITKTNNTLLPDLKRLVEPATRGEKELIGNYRNSGTDYRPKGDPIPTNMPTNMHDFMDKDAGKVVPHGVYDPTANCGWVSVGVTHDTAEFAVQSIRTWLDRMGRQRYPGMRELTITADCGGSNNARSRLWKLELQKLADEIDIPIKVRHYPPGTSKWNKIEHRLFCYITQNWRARPLTSRAAVVELIAATTTKAGLKVECALDARIYEKGIKVSNAEMNALDIRGDKFHPEWNYTVHPRPKKL